MTYYTNTFLGQAGQIARAEHVNEQFEAVATAFAAVETDVGKALRCASAVAAISGNAVARALKWVRFNASGDPELVSAPITFRGAWADATLYSVGDIVTSGAYSSWYYCHTQHTSSGSIDLTKFTLVLDRTGDNRITNELKTASFTAVSGGDYMVDSTLGNVEVTLPASPTISDAPVNITHVAGALIAGQRVDILRNGKPIMGVADDLRIDKANASISLMFCDNTLGWRLRVLA